jgi:uncharacterized protein (DUF2252 family)
MIPGLAPISFADARRVWYARTMSEHMKAETIGMTVRERMALGKELRKKTPRSAHAAWQAPKERPDPVEFLEQTSHGRLADLVPIRYGRMVKTPFTFMRGAAAAMACDLAHTPVSGLTVQLCGDCHLLNFGMFATPERNLVFDVNDFDETLPGPWEWDVKRLATSFVLAGRDNRLPERACRDAVLAVVGSYRQHLREYADMGVLEVWYAQLDSSVLAELATDRKDRRLREKEVEAARADNTARIFPRMTQVDSDGRRRISDHPPRIFHLAADDPLHKEMLDAFKTYPTTIQDNRRFQLGRFKLVDLAMKVVGVGSVGTRCGVFLLMAGDLDPLFLQIKEARPSVLEPYVTRSKYQNQGHRVVTGQRLLQATTDIFLGWSGPHAGDNYYFRQLRDSKGGVDVAGLSAASLIDYARVCGWALAHGHAKSGDAAAISGYLGSGDGFDQAVAAFATTYADQTEQDHSVMKEAVRTGRLVADMEEIQT